MLDIIKVGYHHVAESYLIYIVDAPEGFTLPRSIINVDDPDFELYVDKEMLNNYKEGFAWMGKQWMEQAKVNILTPVG